MRAPRSGPAAMPLLREPRPTPAPAVSIPRPTPTLTNEKGKRVHAADRRDLPRMAGPDREVFLQKFRIPRIRASARCRVNLRITGEDVVAQPRQGAGRRVDHVARPSATAVEDVLPDLGART